MEGWYRENSTDSRRTRGELHPPSWADRQSTITITPQVHTLHTLVAPQQRGHETLRVQVCHTATVGSIDARAPQHRVDIQMPDAQVAKVTELGGCGMHTHDGTPNTQHPTESTYPHTPNNPPPPHATPLGRDTPIQPTVTSINGRPTPTCVVRLHHESPGGDVGRVQVIDNSPRGIAVDVVPPFILRQCFKPGTPGGACKEAQTQRTRVRTTNRAQTPVHTCQHTNPGYTHPPPLLKSHNSTLRCNPYPPTPQGSAVRMVLLREREQGGSTTQSPGQCAPCCRGPYQAHRGRGRGTLPPPGFARGSPRTSASLTTPPGHGWSP
jgi:hypothetical protein